MKLIPPDDDLPLDRLQQGLQAWTNWAAIASPTLKNEPVEIAQLVEDAISEMRPLIHEQGVRVVCETRVQRVNADPGVLRRAVADLLRHSVEVMTSGGDILITSYCDGQQVELEVADSGPDADARPEGSEPWIAASLAKLHGGRLEQARCPQGGMAHTLVIPLRLAAAGRAAA